MDKLEKRIKNLSLDLTDARNDTQQLKRRIDKLEDECAKTSRALGDAEARIRKLEKQNSN
jgi:hypothetical protein